MQAATASANAPGTASSTSSIGDAAVGDRSPSPRQNVGDVRQAEDRLDALIASLDQKAVNAMAAGNKARARELIDQMHAAMASRSHEHQERLNREAWERMQRNLDNGVDYFQVQGRLARERLERGAA